MIPQRRTENVTVIKKIRLLLLDVNDNIFAMRRRQRGWQSLEELAPNNRGGSIPNFHICFAANGSGATLNGSLKCVYELLLTCEVFIVFMLMPARPSTFYSRPNPHSLRAIVLRLYHLQMFKFSHKTSTMSEADFDNVCVAFEVNICRSTCVRQFSSGERV